MLKSYCIKILQIPFIELAGHHIIAMVVPPVAVTAQKVWLKLMVSCLIFRLPTDYIYVTDVY